MSLPNRHDIYAAKFNATLVSGVSACQIPIETTLLSEIGDGSVYPSRLSLAGQKPRVTLTTRCLAQALDVLTAAGPSVSIASLAAGLLLYGYKHAEGGTRSASSDHRQFKATEGIVAASRIRCQHQQDAEIDLEGMITYDGVNEPITVLDNVAAPGTVADDQRFTLPAGGVVIGGVTIPGITDLEIDFGTTVEAEGSDSDIWPTFASLVTAKPVITFTTRDATVLKAAGIPLTGLAGTHANTTIYLRKRANAGQFVADLTAEHIKFTAAGLAVVTQAFDGRAQQIGTVQVRMECYHDGTNTPIAIDTTSAIS